MLQVLIKKGRAVTENVPGPTVGRGNLLIKVLNSCISAGTEISSIQGSGDSLLKRALKQPDKVAKAIQMAKDEGLYRTVEKIKGHLDVGIPTGYSISGIVIDAGPDIDGYNTGDRVAAAGAGMANHAEYVEVPKNLVVRIPENVSFAHGATVTMGAIAMQAVRRADIKLGEYAAVIGTGILGMLAVQLLTNAGARVIAVDIDDKRLHLAKQLGAELCINSSNENLERTIRHYTDGHGVDTSLFCASTTDESVLSQTFAATRKKGRTVMVGTWGRQLDRNDIYTKELDFLISTSYGPGRYDTNYELKGEDYPYAYVRWTENRNMSEYLRLISVGKLQIDPLIQARYRVEKATDAFEALRSADKPLIILLNYDDEKNVESHDIDRVSRNLTAHPVRKWDKKDSIRVAIIGAGSFASGVHLPNLKKMKDIYKIHAVCNRTGASAQAIARQYGAAYATTDYREILADDDVDLVMICTRHNLHGHLVLQSLKADKHTFVEKPLCISRKELDDIKAYYDPADINPKSGRYTVSAKPLLAVGFNRRFSIYAAELKKHIIKRINPVFLHYRMNAGYLSKDHWVHTEEGGGRIVGEACHIIDLFSFLIGSNVGAAGAAGMVPATGSVCREDNKAITIEYQDGSVAVLEYFSIGSEHLEKERLEAHFDQKTIVIDNYKALQGYGIKVKKIATPSPDKGQLQELRSLSDTILGRQTHFPILLESIFETTDLCLRLRDQDQ